MPATGRYIKHAGTLVSLNESGVASEFADADIIFTHPAWVEFTPTPSQVPTAYPGTPQFTHTVVAGNLSTATNVPDDFTIPTHFIVACSGKHGATGGNVDMTVYVNGVLKGTLSGFGASNNYSTLAVPISDVVAGDVITVFLKAASAIYTVDWFGLLSWNRYFPKKTGSNEILFKNLTVTTAVPPVPVSALAAGGTWALSNNTNWYHKNLGIAGNGDLTLPLYGVSGHPTGFFSPNFLGVSSPNGAGNQSAGNRTIMTNSRITRWNTRWMLAPLNVT